MQNIMTRKHHKLIDADSVYNALQRAEDAKRYVDNDSILLAASQIKDILLNPDLSK